MEEKYTERWIKENYHNNFVYLIADGWIDDKNQKIFIKFKKIFIIIFSDFRHIYRLLYFIR